MSKFTSVLFNKQFYPEVLKTVMLILVSEVVALALYLLPVDYPIKPYFLFAAAPGVMLILINLRLMRGNRNVLMWSITNAIIIAAGANFPIVIETFKEIGPSGTGSIAGMDLSELVIFPHAILVGLGTYMAAERNYNYHSGIFMRVKESMNSTVHES